jgi:predicted NACHT family NTPase
LQPQDLEDYIQSLRAALWQSQFNKDFLEVYRSQNVVIEKVLNALNNRKPVAVILGTPGSGKSTTMRWLALQMARGFNSPSYRLPEGISRAQIPILLRINDYAKCFDSSKASFKLKEPDFKEFLDTELTTINDDLPGIIDMELAKGNCLLLLDGLDEVISDDLRRQVAKDIFNFITIYSNKQQDKQNFNRFVITSRIVVMNQVHLLIMHNIHLVI